MSTKVVKKCPVYPPIKVRLVGPGEWVPGDPKFGGKRWHGKFVMNPSSGKRLHGGEIVEVPHAPYWGRLIFAGVVEVVPEDAA